MVEILWIQEKTVF